MTPGEAGVRRVPPGVWLPADPRRKPAGVVAEGPAEDVVGVDISLGTGVVSADTPLGSPAPVAALELGAI